MTASSSRAELRRRAVAILWQIAALLALPTSAMAQPDRIDRLFTGYMARENIAGAVLYVLRDDEPAIVRAWGVSDRSAGTPMRADLVQPIYSTSKQFTAALVLRLVEQGRVELDAPVGRYLPRWFADEPRLEVRHLLRHTSGLANIVGTPEALALEAAPAGTGSIAAMAALADRLPRRFAPGARHAYSNGNYSILAALVEVVTGLSFAEAQRTLLLQPLGLGAIEECAELPPSAIAPGYDSQGNRHALPSNLTPTFAGNGGLCATAEALARWTRALGSGRVVRPSLLAEMRRGGRVAAGYVPPYGFGLSTLTLAGRPAFSHAGGDAGWGAWAAYLPDERITIVILVNRGWFWGTDLGVPLVRGLVGIEAASPLRRLRLSRRERRALTGAFEDGLFEIGLSAEADRLILDNPAFGDPIELWKQSGGRFVSPLRPDTFSLRLVGTRPEFDWAEHRSYLVRRAPAPATGE